MVNHILWIHGWGVSSQVWQEATLYFDEWNHHFVDFSSCSNIAEFHREIQQKLSMHQERWMIVGWSMGAMLAIETWMNNERSRLHQIEAIVLISATLRFVDQDRTKGWPRRVVDRMAKQLVVNPEQVLSQFKQTMFSAKEQNALNQDTMQRLTKTDFSMEGLLAGLNYLMETDLSSFWNQRIASTSSPSPRWLWIHGTDDGICPIGAMPQLSESEAVIIQQAGHIPFLTAKETFFKQLRRFLNEHQ